MQQESPKLNKLQFIRFKKLEKTLKEELKKRDSIQIEIPALSRARISFEFNPALSFGRREELVLLIESGYFNMPVTEKGNNIGYAARGRESSPIYIPLNTSYKNQKINISGISKAYPAASLWNDSDMQFLQNNPMEKIIGFNSIIQPDNYEAMKCTISVYLL